MEQLIRFYELYGMYLDGVFTYVQVLGMVILGIMVRNVWDDKVEVGGTKLLTGALFISLLLYYSTGWLNKKALYFTSLLFGFGTPNLIKKWIRFKVWDKYDFISKKNNRKNKKDDDKDNTPDGQDKSD